MIPNFKIFDLQIGSQQASFAEMELDIELFLVLDVSLLGPKTRREMLHQNNEKEVSYADSSSISSLYIKLKNNLGQGL